MRQGMCRIAKNNSAALAVGPARRREGEVGGQPRAGTFSFVRM
jgi:hypothetical protein